MDQDKTSQEDTTPMQRAFALFRARVQADPSLPDDIKSAVAADLASANPEKCQALAAAFLKKSSPS